MNFLAHIFLSNNDPKIMVGNFIGDFIKGKDFRTLYDSSIVLGIDLHRAIDTFTDDHPVVAESKRRLQPKYRHYAPVIVDIFYDHYLAKNWNTFHPEPLDDYAQRTYKIIEDYLPLLPEMAKHMFPYMVNGNWLVNYGKTEGIQRALSGMSRRTKFISKMEEATDDLILFYTEFESEFMTFFPDLKKYAAEFLESRRDSNR